MDYQITSINNEKIKQVSKLKNAKDRKKTGLFIVEGEKEIKDAIEAGFVLEDLYHCPDYDSSSIKQKNTTISPEIMEKISYRETPLGLLAVFKNQSIGLKDIELSQQPLIIVLENVEKPGNLGAIARSSRAAGVDMIIVTNYRGDIYNPNAIRSSRGHLFSLPIIKETNENTINWLKKNKINIYAATVANGENHWKLNLKESCALILGTEDTGLSKTWLENMDKGITIPMENKVDSLNVSVSAAILAYEAKRQRSL